MHLLFFVGKYKGKIVDIFSCGKIKTHLPAACGGQVGSQFNDPAGHTTHRPLIELLAVLASCLGLLAALDARALIVLTLAHLGQDARLGAVALEALQGVLQGLAIFNTDFRHLFPLPPKQRKTRCERATY